MSAIASSSLLLLSGCEARSRSLSFGEMSTTKQEKGYQVTVQVRAGASNIESPEWGTFHDVELIAMTKQKEKIHRETVGEIGGSLKDTETFSFSVTEAPQYLIYDARESSCDNYTRIDKAVRIKHDGDYIWNITRMTCEEEKEFLS